MLHLRAVLSAMVVLLASLSAPTAASAQATPAPPGPSAAAQAPSKVADLVRQFAKAVARERAANRSAARASHSLLRSSPDGQVELLVHAAGPLTNERRADLRRLGARITAEVPTAGLAQLWLPHARIDDAAALGWVVAVTPPGYGEVDNHPQNGVVSQGVTLHNADDVQTRGINGAGVDVGVISDGVTSLAAAQASNDLPAVTVLGAGAGDEGTAMLEIVHDMAPGAGLIFDGTGGTTVTHINALNNLVANGAEVITEDIAFDSEPAFQRGPVATAGDTIAANGVTVHSSAGNQAQRHAGRVAATGTGSRPDGTATTTFTGCANTPDNVVAIAPSNDTTFDITIPASAPGQTTASFTLQWSEPRAVAPTTGQGGFTDLNLYIMDNALTRCLAQSTGGQGSGVGDTIEQAVFTKTASAVNAKIVVDVQGTSSAVAAPILDLRWRGAGAIDATTREGSLNPDSNYTGLATSSAAVFGTTGALEPFSSAGPVQLVTTTQCPGGAAGPCAGVAGGAGSPANGPAWAAADGVDVSGAGGFGTPFFGTSAAAPHAAACDALLRDARDTPAAAPATTNARLAATAVDIAPSGFDQTTGAGRLDCLAAVNRPPVARIGGPYTTDEGSNAPLSAATSSDPDTTATFTDTLTYAWDLDGDGSFNEGNAATASFTSVGQDGVFPIAVRVTDTAGAVSTAATTVTVRNIAPTVSPAAVTTVAENSAATIAGAIRDPGWLDPLTATIDFGDGSGTQPLSASLENARPDATLTYSLTHTYGDNGTFRVTVCAADDDTTGNCASVDVGVTNVDPTAALDTAGTTLVNGVPTFVTHTGTTVGFSGRSVDPGSDDLTIIWDWDDGAPAPDVSTKYRVNQSFDDPFPSPSIAPRDITDTRAHAFTGACLYNVGLASRDDDGGSAAQSITAIITGDATRNRSAGYWYTQMKERKPSSFTTAQLLCLLKIDDYMSRIFSERNDARTIALATAILNPPTTRTSSVQQFDRQLLAAWLNFANGSVDLATLVDTDGDKVPDTRFIDAVTTAETTRLNPSATSAQLIAQKDILERINLRDGG